MQIDQNIVAVRGADGFGYAFYLNRYTHQPHYLKGKGSKWSYGGPVPISNPDPKGYSKLAAVSSVDSENPATDMTKGIRLVLLNADKTKASYQWLSATGVWTSLNIFQSYMEANNTGFRDMAMGQLAETGSHIVRLNSEGQIITYSISYSGSLPRFRADPDVQRCLPFYRDPAGGYGSATIGKTMDGLYCVLLGKDDGLPYWMAYPDIIRTTDAWDWYGLLPHDAYHPDGGYSSVAIAKSRVTPIGSPSYDKLHIILTARQDGRAYLIYENLGQWHGPIPLPTDTSRIQAGPAAASIDGSMGQASFKGALSVAIASVVDQWDQKLYSGHGSDTSLGLRRSVMARASNDIMSSISNIAFGLADNGQLPLLLRKKETNRFYVMCRSIIGGLDGDGREEWSAPDSISGETAGSGYSNWMSRLGAEMDSFYQKRIVELALPGTHDSGTYGITHTSNYSCEEQQINDMRNTINSTVNRACQAIAEALADSVPATPVLDDFLNLFTGKDTQTLLREAAKAAIMSQVNPVVKSVEAGWSKTQSLPIRDQLKDGIRYIDLRVNYVGGDYRITHALWSVTLNEIIKDVKDFIAKNPQEIIILDLNHLYEEANYNPQNVVVAADMSANASRNLAQKLKDAFGDKILKRDQSAFGSDPHSNLSDIKVRHFWDNSCQILLLFENESVVSSADLGPYFWSSTNSVYNPFYNKPGANDLKQSLTADLDKPRDMTKLYVLQAICTEDNGIIKCGVYYSIANGTGIDGALSQVSSKISALGNFLKGKVSDLFGNCSTGAPINMLQYAGATTPAMVTWLKGLTNVEKKKINVVIVDQYQVSADYVQTVVEMNRL